MILDFRFNGVEFLQRMRGKRIMFVGDSLGRNQWESLICMIFSALPRSSPTHIIKGDPLTTFSFLVSFFILVKIVLYYHPWLVLFDVLCQITRVFVLCLLLWFWFLRKLPYHILSLYLLYLTILVIFDYICYIWLFV